MTVQMGYANKTFLYGRPNKHETTYRERKLRANNRIVRRKQKLA